MKKPTPEQLKATLPLLPSLVWNRETQTHDDTKIPPTALIVDGVLLISGEDGNGFVDYYGEFRGGYPYINPALEQWAKDNGGMWEWMHPGAIGFFQ